MHINNMLNLYNKSLVYNIHMGDFVHKITFFNIFINHLQRLGEVNPPTNWRRKKGKYPGPDREQSPGHTCCDTTWCWLLGGSPLRNCLIRAWKIVSYIIHFSKTCKKTTVYWNKTVHKRSEMCTVRVRCQGGTNHCRSSIAVKHKFKHLHLHTCTQIMAHDLKNNTCRKQLLCDRFL